MISALKNIWSIPDLRRRVMFSFAMLAVYRVGGHIPTPGVNSEALVRLFEQQQGGILSFVDMFSGNNFSQLTIFALGIMPYITASIILQLLTVVWPYLEKLSKEGELTLGREQLANRLFSPGDQAKISRALLCCRVSGDTTSKGKCLGPSPWPAVARNAMLQVFFTTVLVCIWGFEVLLYRLSQRF